MILNWVGKRMEEGNRISGPMERLWKQYMDIYFSHDSMTTLNAALYLALGMLTLALSFVNVFATWIVRGCDHTPDPQTSVWSNPLYPTAECYYQQRWMLLGLSLWQADKGQRMMISLLCGAALGYERRSPDRPAGIKLMSLVAVGSCSFTISSMFSFESSTSHFDTARVAAAIVSGVGFLGSAMIWKGVTDTTSSERQVHGLTTAASVWVAASVGIAAGGYLYFAAIYTTVMVVILLRFGPRSPEKGDELNDVALTHDEETEDEGSAKDRKDDSKRAFPRVPLLNIPPPTETSSGRGTPSSVSTSTPSYPKRRGSIRF